MTEENTKHRLFNTPKVLTMKLEEELHRTLVDMARDKGVSVSALVRWAIVSYLEKGKQNEN